MLNNLWRVRNSLTTRLLFIGLPLVLLLASCSFLPSAGQKAILYINDASTSGYAVVGNVTIPSNARKPIPSDVVSEKIQAHDAAATSREDKVEYDEACEGGNGCFRFEGKPYRNVSATDYYGEEAGIEVTLPIVADKAVLEIVDGNRTISWNFSLPTNSERLYLNIFFTDIYISVTELEGGKMTFTPSPWSSQSPEPTLAFQELESSSPTHAQRGNKWIDLVYAYESYSKARSEANDETCKVFGTDCQGRSSYPTIARAYKKAYEEIIRPMASSLPTYSDDSEVGVVLLQLEKTANKLGDCYFQTYRAAEDYDSNAYDATSACWSSVDELLSDVKIQAKQFGWEISEFRRAGDY